MEQPATEASSESTEAQRPPERIGAFGIVVVVALVLFALVSPKAAHRMCVLWSVSAITTTVHIGAFVVVGRIVGAGIQRFNLFYGGYLFRHKTAGGWLAINWLPFGGYVKFKGQDDEETPPTTIDDRVSGLHWAQIGHWGRASICIAGSAATLALAFLVMSPEYALHRLAATPHDLWRMTTPSGAVEQVRRAYEFLAQADFRTILVGAAIWVSLVNLFPFPPMNGGQLLLELARAVTVVPRRLETTLQYAGLAAVLWCFVITLIACVRAW